MKTLKAFFRRRDIVRVLLIVLFIYPLINLLRKFPFRMLALSLHIKEIIFFLVTIFVLSKIVLFVHRRIAAWTLFREKITWSIFFELFLLIIYTPLVTFPVFWLLFPRYYKPGADLRTIALFTFILFFIQIAYLFYYHLSDYLARFRSAVISQEKLKYENTVVRYKALQSHISPHFIFNCLSGLNAMIHKNPSVASEIVYNLSDCLRHILATLDKKTVTLDEELLFIDKYLYLLDMRSPGCILLENHIDEADKQKRIPPCLLQMLIENAVKHNEVSPVQKLGISMTSFPQGVLRVSNTIARKWKQEPVMEMGTGLNNIRQRYSLLTDKPVSISQTGDTFTVILPLLDNSDYENTDH